MIRAIKRPVVACVVAVLVALLCIFYAEVPRALMAPSVTLDGKQTPYDYSLRVHAAIIAVSVALGIAAAIVFDAELEIDRLRPPPFWPKSAGDWLVVLCLSGVGLSALLSTLLMVLHAYL